MLENWKVFGCVHTHKQASFFKWTFPFDKYNVCFHKSSLSGERGTKIERGTKVYETHNKCEIISKST